MIFGERAERRVRLHLVGMLRNKPSALRLFLRGNESADVFELDSLQHPGDDPREDADHAGLRYVSDELPGIRRKKSGKGFSYVAVDGLRLSDGGALARIRSLAIPPAWTDVWICPFANGHLQATGRDARGRKQYRYHARFRELRDSTKFERLGEFADALPRIRARVREDMGLRGLPRAKVLATVVHLLERTLIRIGNDEYAKDNNSYGLTTLKNKHVAVAGSEVRFQFAGKGGKQWSLTIRNRRVAKIVRACQELPGQKLLQYIDRDGARHDIASEEVNAYLKVISGLDITAKDFRTWAGTVLTAVALCGQGPFASMSEAKRNLKDAISQTATLLRNTPTICRKCYIHPDVVEAYLNGGLRLAIPPKSPNQMSDLYPEEVAVLAFLEDRRPVKSGKRGTRRPRRAPPTRTQLRSLADAPGRSPP